MLAVVKTPRTKFRVEGNIPNWLIKTLKKEYKSAVSIEDVEGESVDVTETAWFKKTKKQVTPGFCLKTYRENLKMTQAGLAQKINETPQHISDMENDRRPISKKNAIKFSEIFSTSVERFI